VGEILEPPPGHHPPIAILGMCPNGMGVSGLSDSHEGVHGRSTSGVGVAGKTVGGIGVQAISESGNGIALQVDGKGIMQAMVDGGTTFSINNAGIQPDGGGRPEAIVGTCAEGIGVHGASEKSHGVHGGSVYGEAIDGHSVYGIGVIGHTDEEGGPGVMGWTFNPSGTGVLGKSDDNGIGIHGQSEKGIGVRASSKNGTALQVEGKGNISATVDNAFALSVSNSSENNGGAINAYSKSAPAVLGGSDANVGIVGMSKAKTVPGLPGEPGLPGIEGFSQFSFGVLGLPDISPSTDFINWYKDPSRGSGGLLGYAKDGKGVVGFADTGIGVLAISKNSPALRVEGKSSFSTVGSDNINSDKQNVKNPLVTSKSHITVTLMDKNPGKVAVSWIERMPGKGFTVHLTDKVQQKVPFTYFIVEP
jgi:hypothetical protein